MRPLVALSALVILALTSVPLHAAQASAPPDPLEALLRARAGEALDFAERVGRDFWPGMQVDQLSLLVLDPGRGGLLFNHPSPPAGFEPAGTVARHRPPPKEGAEPPAADAKGETWAVHRAGEAAVAPFRAARSSHTLAGRRTAVLALDEVTVPPVRFGGIPPSEAVIGRMAGALFLAHLDAKEGEPAADPYKAAYRADAEDLALIALEQRVLAWTLRLTYNEKTMGRYRKLAAEWLAIRKARMARNPAAVALEESIERREGLADYTETLPARLLDDPGREERPDLEAVDPFFDRYANLFAMRVNTVNYPLTWYPAGPEEALRRARTTGAALAGMIWPMRVRWNLDFFGPAGAPKQTLREAIEQALKEGKPEITETDAELLKSASEREGLETIRALMAAALARKAPPAR